jgi:uncharacterized protein
MHTEATCPSCGKPIARAADQPVKRFCSDRCQWVDLGAWIDGRHAIAGDAFDPMHPDSRDETVR